ncbi:RNA 2'-phosphotransferase [Desulfogranum japonicum]|uniref:RNA 2'-phosphotransferase n=1 Tax=Desulfogranum japonicum TaxID=231447 RepID=UPI00040F8DD5|nr:RNA 2'-phosphotransferase [Desulfogranum japonicum]
MNDNIVKASKYLSLLLRHKPEIIGLSLDLEGWAKIEDIVRLTNQNGTSLTKKLIEKITATSDKKRFIISDDGTRIRANQGHSITVDLNLRPKNPPEILFHGTATRFLDSILQQGLIKENRQYVHLSPDRNTALKVGQRHGKPVILSIAAQEMHVSGFVFFLSANGIWLTEHVPTKFLTALP